MNHLRASAVRNIAVLVGLAAVLLLPASALAVPNVLGLYRGFSQSDNDPRLHPRMELMVSRQDDKGNFFGTLQMGTPGGLLPFTFQGKLLDSLGHFKGSGDGLAGHVNFTGIVQDLGGDRGGLLVVGDQGGALVLASYKFTFPDGSVDQGMTHLLRSFPPDPGAPPNITGTWRGTSMSDLTGQQMTLDLQIIQDGTSFEGVEIVGGIQPCVIVGTIGVRGNFVFIGVGDVGRVLVGGQFTPPPDDSLNARYFRALATGAVDLGTFMVGPVR